MRVKQCVQVTYLERLYRTNFERRLVGSATTDRVWASQRKAVHKLNFPTWKTAITFLFEVIDDCNLEPVKVDLVEVEVELEEEEEEEED